ncbi:MAG: T9SS type A sorting domain-containing protein [Candidatus Komeilibacteria bacterium]|nr:T9SS type A sorting domain-containing protein [Candidatus Komeilibacteria bacterium]
MKTLLVLVALIIMDGHAQYSCHLNATCTIFAPWHQQASSVVKFEGATAFFINNSSQDGKLLLITKNHVFPSQINEGDTLETQIGFDYQRENCDSGSIHSTISTVKVVLHERMAIDDRVLMEIIDADTLPSQLLLLGWDVRSIDNIFQTGPDGMVFGHPQGTEKRGALLEAVGYIPRGFIAASGMPNTQGVVESGFSGGPFLDLNQRVRGDLDAVSTGNPCTGNIQYVYFDLLKRYEWSDLSTYLDPATTGTDTCEALLISPAIPVQLLSFTAESQEEGVHLRWKTGTETNNLGFRIMRFQNEKWEEIAFIPGHGTSVSPNSYKYLDCVDPGIYSYCLIQLDYDGTETRSSVVMVEVIDPASPLTVANYPNPFNATTIIKVNSGSEKNLDIRVYNILGEEIETIYRGSNEIKKFHFDGSNLPAGIYILKVNKVSHKMVLLK